MAIIYSDTDSCYYQTFTTDKESAVEIADAVANGINDSFKDFMREAFLCTPGYDDLIKAARELVGERALFQAKKKYVIKVVDLEGATVNKLKSMGSEVKKSDTPKVIQNFLKQVLQQILDGKSYQELEKFINESRYGLLRNSVSDSDLISIGVSKAVNNLDKFYEEWKAKEKSGLGRAKLPGHVRASVNYNEMALEYEGAGASLINSGDKVLIYYLVKNDRNLESIAIPAEMTKFPPWFSKFKIDVKKTEQKMIDSKLEGIFSALGQEVPTPYGTHLKSVLVF
jgi:DNA polymerase elongation subunit (family B)